MVLMLPFGKATNGMQGVFQVLMAWHQSAPGVPITSQGRNKTLFQTEFVSRNVGHEVFCHALTNTNLTSLYKKYNVKRV